MSDRKIYFGKDAISFSDSGITIHGTPLKWSEFYFNNTFKLKDSPLWFVMLAVVLICAALGFFLNIGTLFIIGVFGGIAISYLRKSIYEKVEECFIVKNHSDRISISQDEYEAFKKDTLSHLDELLTNDNISIANIFIVDMIAQKFMSNEISKNIVETIKKRFNDSCINHYIEPSNTIADIEKSFPDGARVLLNELSIIIGKDLPQYPNTYTSSIIKLIEKELLPESVIDFIFNSEDCLGYPFSELISVLASKEKYFSQTMNAISHIQNKAIFELVNYLFGQNVFISLALTANQNNATTNYKEFFDFVMTSYWDNLFVLHLLDDNRKFNIDMGNETHRQLKARISDLEHQSKLLDQAQRARLASEQQAQAAQQTAIEASRQTQYMQQQSEYARQQAAYSAEAAANTAKAAKDTSRLRKHVTGEIF